MTVENWTKGRSYSWPNIQTVTEGEVKAEVGRNWARRGHFRVPEVPFGVSDAGVPSSFKRIQVYQALYFARVTDKFGMSLREAEYSFLKRIENEAYQHHLVKSRHGTALSRQLLDQAKDQLDEETYTEIRQQLSNEEIENESVDDDTRYGSHRPFHRVIGGYVRETMPPEFLHPSIPHFWLIPKDTDGTVRPIEIEVCTKRERDQRVKAIHALEGMDKPIVVNITDIIQTVNDGIERLMADQS